VATTYAFCSDSVYWVLPIEFSYCFTFIS